MSKKKMSRAGTMIYACESCGSAIPDDAQEFADRYEKLIDKTPIDEEWSASVRSDKVKIMPHKIKKDGIWRVHVWSIYNGDTTTCMNAKTRGEVYGLLFACGIKCEA